MIERRLFVALGLAAALAAAGAFAADLDPGTRLEMRIQDLPKPYATRSAANPARIVRPSAAAAPKVPPGFHVNVFAASLADARWLAVAPDGGVFLAEPSAGRVTLLRDTNGDGTADLTGTFAQGFNQPHGLAVRPGYLYVADTERVWRFAYTAGQTKAEGGPEPVTAEGALGEGTGHWTRNIAFSPDGSRFFVTVGSRGNIAEEDPPRATVQEFSSDGTPLGTFASGLRNPVGAAFYPGSGDLYVVVNERDTLGDGLVPDYLTRLERGGFYGWPYSYLGSHPQPGFAEKRPDLVAKAIVPDLLFKPHSAPLGLAFTGAAIPEGLRRRLRGPARFVERERTAGLYGGPRAFQGWPPAGPLRGVHDRLLGQGDRSRRGLGPPRGAGRGGGRQPARRRRRRAEDLAGELPAVMPHR
jgi:glucose/arabinose dehydrogenase